VQTPAQISHTPSRRVQLRVGDARAHTQRMTVSAAVNQLASLRAREARAIRFLVDVIDTALEDENVGWCGELLDALDVAALTDDVALAPLTATFLARLAVPDARRRYAERVRAALLGRGWKITELARAIDDLI
jgi:hypothetical protein